MVYKDPHLSDEDLLLALDGELGARRQKEMRRHLQACWTCRCRMADLERNIANFVDCYHSVLDERVPPQDGHEHLLRARLMNESAAGDTGGVGVPALRVLSGGWLGLASSALAMVLIAGLFSAQHRDMEATIVPNANLTPGEMVPVSASDVCQGKPLGENQAVPEDLREAVFSEYGMKNAPRNDYEVDFLITPELGGSATIRNLWPEPYSSRSWNARTKDLLEQRLHVLVCSGQLDLSTAQREIATNWVDAYHRYVGVKEPM